MIRVAVSDIRRVTRKQYSAEEKIGIIPAGLRQSPPLPRVMANLTPADVYFWNAAKPGCCKAKGSNATPSNNAD